VSPVVEAREVILTVCSSLVDYPAPAEMERRNNPKCEFSRGRTYGLTYLFIFSRLPRPCWDGAAQQPEVYVP
jgi:hypothetical protein